MTATAAHTPMEWAKAAEVVFVSGESFYPDNAGQRQFRLVFSSVTPERIDEGIAILARLLVDVDHAAIVKQRRADHPVTR
jgi:DNA-binding transcriptional MocR family regulator